MQLLVYSNQIRIAEGWNMGADVLESDFVMKFT